MALVTVRVLKKSYRRVLRGGTLLVSERDARILEIAKVVERVQAEESPAPPRAPARAKRKRGYRTRDLTEADLETPALTADVDDVPHIIPPGIPENAVENIPRQEPESVADATPAEE